MWGVAGQVDACTLSWDAIVRHVARGVGVRIWYVVNSSRSLNAEGVKCEFAQFTLHTCLVWGAQLWKTETARQDSLNP